ncbi:MAG: RNA methyltransferase [Ignavibacteriae bacterium]|nr:RNA methyltransferase [Ignavibacteriota bacterium]
MISKSELKSLSKLTQKKYRISEQKFIIEGKRLFEEGLKSNFKCLEVLITEDFENNFPEIIKNLLSKKIRYSIINNVELEKLSSTKNPQGIIASFEIPSHNEKLINDKIIICLDNISDPGNVGTILRSCDWFGVKTVLLSKECAELFNPKVLRASMGAIFNLNIFEDIDLVSKISELKKRNYKIYLADLDGIDYKKNQFNQKSVIIFSNEAFGPTKELVEICDTKITIPKKGNIDSLNVSAAAAVILSAI